MREHNPTVGPPPQRHRPVIRLFVSSTFSDMKHERNAWQRDVFPKLEEFCTQQGFQFQAIDLRWGVPTEAGLDHRTMQICFEELRRSQEVSPLPNFLILLGDRYGWRPLPEKISENQFDELMTAAKAIDDDLKRVKSAIGTPQPFKVPTTEAILEAWYLRDDNNIPPVYILRSSVGTPESDGETWRKIETLLRAVAERAYGQEPFNAERFRQPPMPKEEQFGQPPFPKSVRFKASATEQEIWGGAFNVPNAHEHVVAIIRRIENLNEFSGDVRCKDFVDLDPNNGVDQAVRDLQIQLQNEVSSRLSRKGESDEPQHENQDSSVPQDAPTTSDNGKVQRVHRTAGVQLQQVSNAKGNVSLDITTNHINALCMDVLEQLKPIIQKQIDDFKAPKTTSLPLDAPKDAKQSARDLELEREAHQRFADERAPVDGVIGREAEKNAILTYLANEDVRLMVVHGPSGCGKTALLAYAAREAQALHANAVSLVRFLGTTAKSSDARSLLVNLCSELRRTYPLEAELPLDENELVNEFYDQLQRATPSRPIHLFLDALDQLEGSDETRHLWWLRSKPLPTNAKLVVSCISDSSENESVTNAYQKLIARHPEPILVSLDSLSFDDARMLLFDTWLLRAGRKVSPAQQTIILSRIQPEAAVECRSPLYLKIVFEEARRWRSFDEVPPIGSSVSELLENLLRRLSESREHGPLVETATSYIASARYGLSENELLEVLFDDKEYKKWLDAATKNNCHELPEGATRIPIAIWSRLRFDLGPYLIERGAPGGTVLHFYHRHFSHAVRKCYLQTTVAQRRRFGQLSSYFDRETSGPLRTVTELPWLLEQVEDFDGLQQFLTTLKRSATLLHWNRSEWSAYWRSTIDQLGADFDIGVAYHKAWLSWQSQLTSPDEKLQTARGLADALTYIRRDAANTAALSFFDTALTFSDPRSKKEIELAKARVLYRNNRQSDANPVFQDALRQIRASDGADYTSDGEQCRSLPEMLSLLQAELRQAGYPDSQVDEHVKKWAAGVVGHLVSLADGLTGTDHPEQAEPILWDVLQLLELIYGRSSPELSTTLNNLGLAQKKLGKYVAAEASYRRALEIDSATFPENDSRIAIELRNLGSVLSDQGLYNQARRYLRQAIQIEQSLFKDAHPSVALAWHNYGEACKQQGDLVAAEDAFRQAYEVELASHSRDRRHPSVLLRQVRLAGVASERGNAKEAQAMFDEVIQALVETRAVAFTPEGLSSRTLSTEQLGVLATISHDVILASGDLPPSTACRMRARHYSDLVMPARAVVFLGVVQIGLCVIARASPSLLMLVIAIALLAGSQSLVRALSYGLPVSVQALWVSLVAATAAAFPWSVVSVTEIPQRPLDWVRVVLAMIQVNAVATVLFVAYSEKFRRLRADETEEESRHDA